MADQVTSTTTTEPWGPQQTYLKRGLSRADRSYGDFGRVAGLPSQTRQGLSQMYREAQQGTPGVDQAYNYGMDFLSGGSPDQYGYDSPDGFDEYGMKATAQGDYLNSNPYLDQTINQALDPVESRVNSQFAGSGRYGSGMHSATMADEMSDVSSRMAYQNYADERGRQQQAQKSLMGMDARLRDDQRQGADMLMSADARFRDDQRQTAGMMPSLDQARYADEAKMMQVGDVYRQQRQRELDAPENRLNSYMGLVSGNYGSQSTQPYYYDQTGQTIGNIASGIGAAAQGINAVSSGYDFLSGFF